ncbi:hypothetical protein [Roseibium sp.]|uniref:hypothetical protein n=1 Tax=Roseibium sp. TaxID=1936156 RepID=UPI003D10596C
MTWNILIRRVHRWLSLAFTAAVITNIAAMVIPGQEATAMWIGLLALVPLIPLLITGLYLFVQPFVRRRNSA